MRDLINVVLNPLLEEMKPSELETHKYGLGFETLYGDGFCLTGGARCGNSPAGMTRQGYLIIDTEHYKTLGDGEKEKANLGIIKLMVSDDDKILAIVDIKLNPKNRKAGIGSVVVKSLVMTAPDDLVLFDIQKRAIGFWKKMGAHFFSSTGTPIDKPKDYKMDTLMGIISKTGGAVDPTGKAGFKKKMTFKVQSATDTPKS